MSDEGIREFQDMLDDPLLPMYMRGYADRQLWQAEVKVSADTTPLTWQFLNRVVAHLKAGNPWVSDEPIHVKAREVAPHLMKELWCESGRIEVAAQDVAETLNYAQAFGIYAECRMDDTRLGLDSRHGSGKGTMLDNARAKCAAFATWVLNAMAEYDLDPD
jgi:hypothetical protein